VLVLTALLASAAVGCSAGDGTDVSASEATESLDGDEAATAWCPAPGTLTLAESPRDYLRPIEVKLDSALDGDTAYFRLSSGTVQRVRFMHINAEEVKHSTGSAHANVKATPFGEYTQTYVRNLLERAKTIHIASHRSPTNWYAPDADVFDRWLALIWVDGELLQQKLVQEGFSAYYTKYGCAKGALHDILLRSEAEANQQNKGVWNPAYREEHRPILESWIETDACRPNPLAGDLYCPAK